MFCMATEREDIENEEVADATKISTSLLKHAAESDASLDTTHNELAKVADVWRLQVPGFGVTT